MTRHFAISTKRRAGLRWKAGSMRSWSAPAAQISVCQQLWPQQGVKHRFPGIFPGFLPISQEIFWRFRTRSFRRCWGMPSRTDDGAASWISTMPSASSIMRNGGSEGWHTRCWPAFWIRAWRRENRIWISCSFTICPSEASEKWPAACAASTWWKEW